MSRTTRNSFNDSKNYKKVQQQFGTPVVDSEANEAQDILTVDGVERGLASMTSKHAADPVSPMAAVEMRYPIAVGGDFKIEAAGTAKLFVRKGDSGSVYIDGYRYMIAADLDLSALGIAFPVPANDTYCLLYADITLTEIDSTADPNIALPNWGEGARRVQLTFTWHTSESIVSFAAALAAITALPAASDRRIFNGNTARAFFARFVRRTGTANITAGDVLDLRQQAPSGLFHRRFLKTYRQGSGTGDDASSNTSDGMVAWNAGQSRLFLGIANGQADTRAEAQGAVLLNPGGLQHRFAATTGVVWAAAGGGVANGTPIVPEYTKGHEITEGKALGWRGDAAFISQFSLSNPSPSTDRVVSVTPVPAGYTVPPLRVQTLQVDNLSAFTGDPSAFILCTRHGADLIWHNGQVTRGDGDKIVFDELGAVPNTYTAIIGASGSNHLTQPDAVERALNWMADGMGATTLGSNRNLRFHVRAGLWTFARGLKTYGTAAELAAAGTPLGSAADVTVNSLEIHGEGPGATLLRLSNPDNATRGTATSLLTLRANRVVLDGLTMEQIEDVTFRAGYLLKIEAHTVVLRNVTFLGGVHIVCNDLVTENCIFSGINNTTYYNYVIGSGFGGSVLTAQHLFLDMRDDTIASKGIRWRIQDCMFLMGTDVGTHASIVYGLASSTGVISTPDSTVIRNCVWAYNKTSHSNPIPAIHVPYREGHLEIANCRFTKANGVLKAGNNPVADGVAAPFNGKYGGAPFVNGGVPGDSGPYFAAGYISVVGGRLAQSSLDVHNCDFDLSDVGSYAGVAGDTYVMWGGLVVMCNTSSLGTARTFANINFHDNHVQLGNSTGWGVIPYPCVWGVYVAPTWQDCVATNDLAFTNVQVCNNTIDLGGGNSGLTQYRGVAAANLAAAWVGSFPTDTSGPIVVSLKNTNSGFGVFSGRTSTGVRVRGNSITQATNGGSAFQSGTITLRDNTTSRGTFYGIRLESGGFPTTQPTLAEAAGPPCPPTQVNQFYGPEISDNTIWAPAYKKDGASSWSMAGAIAYATYAARFSNNHVFLSIDEAGTQSFAGLSSKNGLRALFSNNHVYAGPGIDGTGVNDYAQGNVIYTGSAAFVGVPLTNVTKTSTAGAWGENFGG